MSKSFKEKIEQLEEKHRVIADNLIDAIWSLDVETLKFDYITPSIEKISGYTADEYMNFTIQERMTPESFQKVTAILAEEIPRFEQGMRSIRTLEVELIHKNGSIYWAEIRVRFTKEAGKPLKIIGATREITEQKKAEHKCRSGLKPENSISCGPAFETKMHDVCLLHDEKLKPQNLHDWVPLSSIDSINS
jgi:PAS domain S-box-containing protein